MRRLNIAAVCGLALLLCLGLVRTVQAEDIAFLTDEIREAVEARRGETALSKLAESMEPGTWAELETERPDRLWSAPPPGRGLHIGTWSDDAHWDSRTGQFLFFGVRQTRKFVAYSEEDNAWRVIDFHEEENAPGLEQRFGHQYSGNAHDPVRSHFYTNNRRYNVLDNTWEALPSWQRVSRERSMTISYSTGMDRLFVLIHQPRGVLRFFDAGEGAWKDHETIPVHGYHSLARDNPFREEVLFVGGNDSEAVAIVTKDGTVKQMKDFPEPITVRSAIVTVDPLSGRYLMMANNRAFYEFDSENNEYRLIDNFTETPLPFPPRSAPLVAFIPEYGVTMWADQNVMLYKHDAPVENEEEEKADE